MSDTKYVTAAIKLAASITAMNQNPYNINPGPQEVMILAMAEGIKLLLEKADYETNSGKYSA